MCVGGLGSASERRSGGAASVRGAGDDTKLEHDHGDRADLEELKRESAIVLEGFNPFDAWDSRRIAGFLEELEARGFIAARYDPKAARCLKSNGLPVPKAWHQEK